MILCDKLCDRAQRLVDRDADLMCDLISCEKKYFLCQMAAGNDESEIRNTTGMLKAQNVTCE